MDLAARLLIFTVLVAPALYLAVQRFTATNGLRVRPLIFQLVILYSLCELLGAAEAELFLLSVFMVVFASLNACNLVHYLIYRTPISASAFGEIFLTSTGEWLDYLASIRGGHLAVAAGYVGACVAAIAAFHGLALAETSHALPAGLALGAALALTVLRGNSGNFYPLRYAFLIAEAAREMADLNRSVRSSGHPGFSAAAVPPPVDQKFVVVIGEAVRRRNLSIYGYRRDTTPDLAAVADELIVFEDAVSAGNLTRVSLGLALTTASVTDGSGPGERTSIVQAARAAGFETHWISNQPRLGFHETEVSVLAAQADHAHFFNTDVRGRVLDGRMLPAIADALAADRPAVVFIHMMGSHPRYEHRIDDGFRRFTSDAGYKNDPRYRELATDNYDNTILYLDHFLAQVMNACRDSARPCLLTFFSDHGHSLFDDGDSLYHGLANPVRKEYEVPYFYWANPEFRRRYPDNAVLGLPSRVPGRAHLQQLFDDLVLAMGLRIEGYETRETNFRGLSSEGPDLRKVRGRDKVVDYARLP